MFIKNLLIAMGRLIFSINEDTLKYIIQCVLKVGTNFDHVWKGQNKSIIN